MKLIILLFGGMGIWLGVLAALAATQQSIPLAENSYFEDNYSQNNYDFSTLPYVFTENYKTVTATVTAYNTVPSQTDGNPCISANGDYVCDNGNYAACPRAIPFGTVVVIAGNAYVCNDRTAGKYDGRFDINMGTDIEKAMRWGKRKIEVKIYPKK